MARWEPDAKNRLLLAAIELFEERGFEQTTVEEIATRAGLTKRTFFRHYADKREVLFGGGDGFQRSLAEAVAGAPEDAAPLDAVGSALTEVAESFQERADFSRRRQLVIAANPSLQERELVKLASTAQAVAAALRDRGVPEPAASVTAETGMAVLRIAFEQWAAPGNQRSLPALIGEALAAVRTVAV